MNPEAEATIPQVSPEIAASAAERLVESIEIHKIEKLKKPQGNFCHVFLLKKNSAISMNWYT